MCLLNLFYNVSILRGKNAAFVAMDLYPCNCSDCRIMNRARAQHKPTEY